MSNSPTPNKIFVGGLSWETTDAKLRAYFENFGSVLEAFVSYDRQSGRPRGFGFVVFESAEVAEKVVASKHMIDRREVEAKKAVPKEENPSPAQPADAAQRTRKIFVGGLAPSVDEQVLRQYFEQFGAVDDSVVMYDHDNKRPRGFGFITFADEEAVEKVFAHGAMQNIHDKHIEIKRAVPREHMPPPQQRRMPPFYQGGPGGRGGMPGPAAAYGRMQPQQYGAAGFRHSLGGPYGPGRHLQGVMSPRSLAAAGISPGYGGGSPQARGGGGGYGGGGMGGGPYGGQPVPGAGGSRFPAPGGVGGGGAGSSRGGFPGSMQQPFGSRGGFPGGLGFGAGGDGGGGLVEPGGVSMYSLQQQLQQQQLLPTQHQLALNGMGGGYPGQLDPTMGMPKLGGLTGQTSAGAAAAAAAAAIAKHGYGVQPGVGSGGVGAFAGFQPPGQQQFGGAPDPTAGYPAAEQPGGGYASDPHGVPHLGSGTSPLGTTPDFSSFGAGAGAGWGS